MITRRQPPVKQNPQSFLHCRKIAENRRKTQKRCKFNLQIGCGFYPFRLAAARQSTFPKGTAELPQSKPDGFASSLGEGAFGMAGRFLVALETLALMAAACALSVKAYGFASSPKGRAKSTAGNLLFVPNALASRLTAWLSLRGKTSPAPGEDVTVGDKRGNLARERLRGCFPEKICKK